MYDYVKHLRWAKLKVGVVFTTALIVLFVSIMFAGNIEKIFSPRVKIHAVFDDVKGLREGSPVWFSGVEIGSVTEIEFTPQQKIMASMSISSDVLKYIKTDSLATILTLGLLGDKYVELSAGSKDGDLLRKGGTMNGVSQVEIQDIVETSQKSIARLSDFINMLEEILVKIDKGGGTISKFIKDPSLYDNLKETTGDLSRLAGRIERGEGSMGRLLKDEELYLDISSSARDIKVFAERLKESDGSLNRLVSDPALYDRFLKASESLDSFAHRLEYSKGTVNSLIEDKSLYDNVNDVSERLNLLLDGIERGEGVMGSLFRDDDLSEDLKTTLIELNLLLKDIKEHPSRYFKFSFF
jgi:phospholipid/cholesterol/gamma-HCH transport system substrate-binding protein